MPALVESHLADAAFTQLDQASMPARVTLQRAGFEMFGQLGRTFSGHRVDDCG
jgi:hypothetical protein